MSRTIEYLDDQSSPVTSVLDPDGIIILSGEIAGAYITLIDENGNISELEAEQSEGGPILRPRRPR